MEKTVINKLSKHYAAQGILLTVILLLTGLLVKRLWLQDELPVTPLTISVCYMLAIVIAEATVWRWVAIQHTESLPTFFTAVSGFRLLFALATMFVYYLTAGQGAMLNFFLVFMIFYVVQLVHHSVFFAKVSNLS